MRFFHAGLSRKDSLVTLDAKSFHHAGRVVRLRHGDPVTIMNGKGLEVSGVILFDGPGKASVQVLKARHVDKPHKTCILGLAVPDCRDTSGFIIRSAVELGVTEIRLLLSRYCGYRKTGDVHKFMKRLNTIMIAACQQSGRLWMPDLKQPMDLTAFHRSLSRDITVFIGWEPELDDRITNPETIELSEAGFCWLVGPEGGWSPEDRSVIQSWNPCLVRFGSATLTTPVAAIAGLSALKTMHREWQ